LIRSGSPRGARTRLLALLAAEAAEAGGDRLVTVLAAQFSA